MEVIYTPVNVKDIMYSLVKQQILWLFLLYIENIGYFVKSSIPTLLPHCFS